MESSILCTLTEAELKERRRTLLEDLRRMQIGAAPLSNGYSYAFEPTSDTLMRLSHLVDVERQCCQFLIFTIIVAAAGVPIHLEVTGPPEAKAIIADLFGSALSDAET